LSRCFIFGALSVLALPEIPTENDLVIAADKGVLTTEKFNIIPDFIVGDFDSLGFVPKGKNVITLSVRKDDTDVGFAVKTAVNKGYRDFVIYGCVGGNLSHTLANLQIAKDLCESGCSVKLYGGKEIITLLSDDKVYFDAKKQGRVSVLSLSDESIGVTIEGLSYTLRDAVLKSSVPLGVSNEFIGCESRISVKRGCLAIIEEN